MQLFKAEAELVDAGHAEMVQVRIDCLRFEACISRGELRPKLVNVDL